MTDMIEIQWTTSSIEDARKVARHLIEERLAASAQLIPWLESITLLEGRLETLQETKLLLKTTHAHLDKITAILKKNSRYEIPEITYSEIHIVNEEYHEWLTQSS